MLTNLYFRAYPLVRSRIGKNRRESEVRFHSKGKNLHKAYDPNGGLIYFSEKKRCRLYFYPKGIKGRLKFIEEKYSHPGCRVENGDVVFDVGANIGEFSIAIAPKAKKIFSFDPDPNCFDALFKNALCQENIFVSREGLGERVGLVSFHLASSSADSSFIRPDVPFANVSVPVNTLERKIEELGFNCVDFLKLEAEGFEPEILEGAGSALRRFRKIAVDVSPERHGKSPKERVKILLKDRGFNVWSVGSMIFAKL